jgi:hypothetical protein
VNAAFCPEQAARSDNQQRGGRVDTAAHIISRKAEVYENAGIFKPL